jgi:hypothetical protein
MSYPASVIDPPVIIGHVAMSKERYALLTPDQRNAEWTRLIGKLDTGDRPWLPIPFTDDTTDTVGMNLVGL